MERETLKSRMGFILLSAGCAIGIGNVWKFPYMAGQGGGGAFVLFYFIFLVILGLPIMTMEFAVGRASRRSPVKAYQELEKPGSKWHIHGYFTLIGCYLLMMFYTTVTGWMLYYFYLTAAGKFDGADVDTVSGTFTGMLGKPGVMTLCMVIVVCIGIFVCMRGLQSGLERITKIMMIALLVIMVVLAINSFFMPGAKEGLKFYLLPDFDRMQEVGIMNTLVGAMNQAFFTLSLGIGAMAIFGSYIGKDHSLLGESTRVVILDTFVAITSGLIIFPACFTYNVRPDFRAKPDLHHAAEYLREHVDGQTVGKPVLPVHVVRSTFDGSGCVRKHHQLRHGAYGMQPKKIRSRESRSDHSAVAPVRSRIQSLELGRIRCFRRSCA